MSAATGRDIPRFPFRTRGRIMSPVLLTRAIGDYRSLQIVVPAADGHLYIIDGIIGEAAAQALCKPSFRLLNETALTWVPMFGCTYWPVHVLECCCRDLSPLLEML